MIKEIVRHMIAVDKIRPDGRKVNEVRPVSCEVGLFKRTHGTGLFTRGQTQILSFATLAPLSEAQHIDGVGTETERRYMHHYNFRPSASVKLVLPAVRVVVKSVTVSWLNGLLLR